MTLCLLMLVWLVLMLGVVHIGRDRNTGKPIYLPDHSWRTHWHFIGATGKGKTTALETILHKLLRENACFVIIDRMGGFSDSLLWWTASRYCPASVRRRLLYWEPAREDVVLPFNPLRYDTLAHGYYKVQRAVECILRGWAQQNIEETPRLARWIFNAFWAVAQLGLAVADCIHLLIPGSRYHRPLLSLLPPMLQAEWREILTARNGEAARMLESSRNRMKPFFECEILRWLYGSTRNNFDVQRLIEEKRIVLINLAPLNRVPPQAADAIGGMVINEVLAVARSRPVGHRATPIYVVLDEFQRFVSPDIEDAIPEVRQLNVRMMFSHQSFSQLERGQVDLRSLIWQPQSRMIFGLSGEDAELLAHELASLEFDPRRVKEELYTLRQLQRGHRIIELGSWAHAHAAARNWSDTIGLNWSHRTSRGTSNGDSWSANDHRSVSRRPGVEVESIGKSGGQGGSRTTSESEDDSEGGNRGHQEGGGRTDTDTRGGHESLVPIYEEFHELVSRTFYTFEEQKALAAQEIRRESTGQTLLKIANDPTVYRVDVTRDAPGYLAYDREFLARKFPAAVNSVHELLAWNFEQDYFVTPAEIETETQRRLETLARPTLQIAATAPVLIQHESEEPAVVSATPAAAVVVQVNPFD